MCFEALIKTAPLLHGKKKANSYNERAGFAKADNPTLLLLRLQHHYLITLIRLFASSQGQGTKA
jgi:hypothetical protein